jgi:hypothetical protein
MGVLRKRSKFLNVYFLINRNDKQFEDKNENGSTPMKSQGKMNSPLKPPYFSVGSNAAKFIVAC